MTEFPGSWTVRIGRLTVTRDTLEESLRSAVRVRRCSLCLSRGDMAGALLEADK